jgi:protein SHQ1
MGDPTVESAWTVGKLCPYFACLDDSFKDIKTLMRSCTRRALTFPLYRHWNLSMKVWDDVYRTLRGGRTALLKRFAILLKLFEQERYSVYRQIWLEDYTVWVQYANENVIRSLAHELHKVQLAKSDVGLELEESEEIAQEFIAAGGE